MVTGQRVRGVMRGKFLNIVQRLLQVGLGVFGWFLTVGLECSVMIYIIDHLNM